MNAANFTTELISLIVKWTSPSANNSPLTAVEIVGILRDVLPTLLETSEEVINQLAITTPLNSIPIITPSAPVVSKINNTHIDEALSSWKDSLKDDVSQNLMDFPLSPLPENDATNYKKAGLETQCSEKKDTPLSTNKKKMDRSDTFIREHGDCSNFDTSPSITITETEDLSMASDGKFLHRLELLRNTASALVEQIDAIKKPALPPSVRPIRRLSAIEVRSICRSNTVKRTTSPPKLRRSITNAIVPGTTPTSSRLSVNENKNMMKKKSVSSNSINLLGTTSLSLPVKEKSTSSLSLPVKTKDSLSPILKQAKNPKYAHVQSTIPKATSCLKKTDQKQPVKPK